MYSGNLYYKRLSDQNKIKRNELIKNYRDINYLSIKYFIIDRRCSLSLHYYQRILKFIKNVYIKILQSYKNPVEIQDYYIPVVKKSIGSFRYNSYFKEKDRIEVKILIKQETLKHNKELELSPLNFRHEFRPRNHKKEIGPEFRFKHRTEKERISDSMQNEGLSVIVSQGILDRSDNKISDIKMKLRNRLKTINDSNTNLDKKNQEKANEMKKFHFKAATSLFLRDMSSFLITNSR